MIRFLYILKKFVLNIWGRPLAVLGSVLSLFLLFLLFSLVWTVSLTVTNFYDRMVSDIDIEIFLDEVIPDSTAGIIRETLGKLEGVERVDYITREAARVRLQDMLGVDLLEGLDENPLPRSVILSFEPNYLNSDNLNRLSSDLYRLQGVDDIFYPSHWLEKAEFTRILISDLLILLGTVIGIAVILYCIHAIILSARTRAEELIQMQLMGGGPVFLSLPYMIEGIFYALVSAAAAWTMTYYAAGYFTFQSIEIFIPTINEIVYFCLGAAAIGMIGGYIGIRRSL